MISVSLKERAGVIGTAIRRRWKMWLTTVFGFAALYYAALMVSLIVKFGNFPNYAVAYDWFDNVWHIIKSTPSVSDMIPIIQEEWLFEIGYMNYDYGHGISEWSLNIIPPKVLLVLVLGALIATHIALWLDGRTCNVSKKSGASTIATGSGATLVALTAATMSWVVCCATPSWIVGLSMLGLSVSMSLWLEPIGPIVSVAGFTLLAIGLYAASTPRTNVRSGLAVMEKEHAIPRPLEEHVNT